MPVCPLIADPVRYRPCIQDLLSNGVDAREYWLRLFEAHVETLAELPVGQGRLRDQSGWKSFRNDYLAGLAELRRNPGRRGRLNVLELTIFREEQFAAHGFPDPFAQLKQRENALALERFAPVLADIDACPPSGRWERLVRGVLAGNLFDMGSKAAVDAFGEGVFDFLAARDKIPPRPWPVDQLDEWSRSLTGGPHGVCGAGVSPVSTPGAGVSPVSTPGTGVSRQAAPPRRRRHSYRQALFFVDNAGPDILLGVLPLVRELARRGMKVVLAANSSPALNDITAVELRSLLAGCEQLDGEIGRQIRDRQIAVVESGCRAPLIDLSDLSEECCAAAADSDLLILEGMGRAIESNYDARFTVDTVKLALIKDRMVASLLGVNLFDAIFRFEPAP